MNLSCFVVHPPFSPAQTRARRAPCCSLADRAAHEAQPLSRSENNTLLSRMLQLALKEQDFHTAARIRDARRALDDNDPTAKLRAQLQHALDTQDFAAASALRDRIDERVMMTFAERAKPKFPIGLVVTHKCLGYRMILFGVDYRCRTARGADSFFATGLNERGDDQPWYHAAVDERDKTAGDNIVYVAEDDCCPASEGTLVQHPITRIMFKGVYERTTCPGLTCYIPCGREEEVYEEYP